MLSKEQLLRLKALTPAERRELSERLRGGKIPVFRAVAQALRQCGIRRVSGIIGTPLDALFPALRDLGLPLIGVRHQNAATLAAAADNYLSGTLCHAVVVSAGPAVTNTVTGILAAMQNHWPLLVIGGRRPVTDEGCGYFQEFDAVPLMASITKCAATLRHADGAAELVREACQRAIDGQPGPVYLDLPEDVAEQKAYAPRLDAPVRDPGTPPSEEDAELCLRLLRAARRPLVCLGEGLRWNGHPPVIRAFLEREGIPFITTPLGRGIVSDAHPLCQNHVRRRILTQADLVVMAGAWFDWRLRFGSALDPQARVVHVHPDAAELGRNVGTVQTVLADPGMFLDVLESASAADPRPPRAQWCPAPAGTAASPAAPRPGAALHPREMFETLRPLIPAEAITAIEGSFTLSYGQFGLAAENPFSWLDPGWNGCIGCGLPFAIGAKLSQPGRPAVAIVGDMGFGMHGAELETAARYNIPVILVIANNSGINGRVRQRKFLGGDDPPFALFGPELAYHDIARALGVHSALVNTAAELRDAFQAALDSGRPACINVIIDPMAALPGIW